MFAIIFCISENFVLDFRGIALGFASSILGSSFFGSSFCRNDGGFISICVCFGGLLSNKFTFGFSISGFGIIICGWDCDCGGLLSNKFTFGFSISGFGMIICGWDCGCGGLLSNKFTFGFSIVGACTCNCWTWTGFSICGFIASPSLLTKVIFSLRLVKNEGFDISVLTSIFLFIFLLSILSPSLKNDILGFSLTGSALSSSSKNDNLGFGFGCSITILFSFFSILSNKFNLGLDLSCSTLRFTLILFSILGGLLLFSSSKNDILGFDSVCFGASSNIETLGLFILFWTVGWSCWVNIFNFFVISAVLSTIFAESISSSSSLSNIFFNLFRAFSKSLFFFISIPFVSSWNNPNWDCTRFGCWIGICCCCIGVCWFIWSCDNCTCNWGGLIIWIWDCWGGICICCWLLIWGWFNSWFTCGLGIPIIIIGWLLFLFNCAFGSKFWFIWAFISCNGFLFGSCVCFLLKRFDDKTSSSSSSSPPKKSTPPRKAFKLTLFLFKTIFLPLITGAKGFLLSASVCNKSSTELGLLFTILVLAPTSALLLIFIFTLPLFPCSCCNLFLSIVWKSTDPLCGWDCCPFTFVLFISGFSFFFCASKAYGFTIGWFIGITVEFWILPLVWISGGGGGGGGGGGIAPPDFEGSGAETTKKFDSFCIFWLSPSFSIGTLTSGSSFFGTLFANVFDASSFFFFFSFSLLILFCFFFLIFSHFSFCFWSTSIPATNSSTSESLSSSSSSFFFSFSTSSSSSFSLATFNPIALSVLNSSVPIIKGNLTFALLSIIIFELITETVSSSISCLFLFFLLIVFKQSRDILIAVFIFSTFVIWISFEPSIILFSFETDSVSLSSPLSKACSMNLSVDNIFIWLIAFKCSISTASILLEKLSIFLQNCWNSSL